MHLEEKPKWEVRKYCHGEEKSHELKCSELILDPLLNDITQIVQILPFSVSKAETTCSAVRLKWDGINNSELSQTEKHSSG